MIKRVWISPDQNKIAWLDDEGILTEYDTIEERDSLVVGLPRSWVELWMPPNP